MKLTIVLPYPDAALNPNTRHDRRAMTATRRAAHDAGYYAALEAAGPGNMGADGHLPVALTFYPPDRRGRDLDNAYASMKAAMDGVAQALEINDKQLRPVTLDWGDTEKPGRVTVEITL